MVARNRARYLAPIALVATISATYLVVHGSLSTKHSTTTTRTRVVLPTHTSSHSKAGPPPNVYVVQGGDNLSTIAVKTKVPLATLEALNPGVDPNALQAGQRLTLRK